MLTLGLDGLACKSFSACARIDQRRSPCHASPINLATNRSNTTSKAALKSNVRPGRSKFEVPPRMLQRVWLQQFAVKKRRYAISPGAVQGDFESVGSRQRYSLSLSDCPGAATQVQTFGSQQASPWPPSTGSRKPRAASNASSRVDHRSWCSFAMVA